MHPKALKSGNPSKLRRGAWGYDEDTLLRKCIEKYGEGKWHLVPRRAGLNRCRKSCRLRWLNYLKPTIKRGDFGEDEVDLMLRLHKLLGNRWSLIAGRLPGRTANDVKNYWNTKAQKKLTTTSCHGQKEVVKGDEELINRKQVSSCATTHVVVKPLPQTLSKSTSIPFYLNPNNNNNNSMINKTVPITAAALPDQDGTEWWKNLFAEIGIHGQEEGSMNGLSMASSSGLENLGGLTWKTDETTAAATEATGLLEEDGQDCWRDIWDILNSDYNQSD